jgi:hypothetical protein
MADLQGNFVLDASAPAAGTASVFRQLTDLDPYSTFPVDANLAPTGQTPTVIPLPLELAMPMGDNCDAAAARNLHHHGPLPPMPDPDPDCPARDTSNCTTNAGPCCLDYDGIGDDAAYVREGANVPAKCTAKAIVNWTLSTCYNWTFGSMPDVDTSCSNEAAYHPMTQGAPGCWNNHKGRNCQQLDLNALSVAPSSGLTVAVGDTLDLTISNNTPGNETQIGFKANGAVLGALTGDGLSGGPVIYTLAHYDSGPTGYVHQVDRTVHFTAPTDLKGEAAVINTLLIQSHGMALTANITVTKQRPLHGTFSLDWTTLTASGTTFHVDATATLAVKNADADGTWYTMGGTAEMKTTSFLMGGALQCSLPDGEAQHGITKQSDFIAWNSPPAVTWTFVDQWTYTCADGMTLPVLIEFSTTTGTQCGQGDKVPVTDATAPQGSFTMSCAQPSYGGAATWSFAP